MIRDMYRWTVKKEDIEKFGRTWGKGTLKIQTYCTGAMVIILLRSSENPEHFFGMARLFDEPWNDVKEFIKEIF
jgi:hypothetical protein